MPRSRYDDWSTEDLRKEIKRLREEKRTTTNMHSAGIITQNLKDIARTLQRRGL